MASSSITAAKENKQKAKASDEKSCIFCKIVKGELPCSKIYEDKDTFAFLDIYPINKGHTLIIPKQHFMNIFDVPEPVLKTLVAATKKIAEAVAKGMNCDGVNVGMNNNSAAGQVVYHIHFHVIPRFKDDGLKLWPQSKYASDEEKQAAAERIRAHIE